MNQRETSAAIEDAAVAWAVRLDLAPLTPSQRAELDAWLAADPRRLGAFARARAVMVYADRARILAPNFDHGGPDPFDGVESPRGMRLPTRRWAIGGAGALAAGVAAAAAGLGFQVWRSVQRYETVRGEVRRLPLVDGTVVTLDTATTVAVKYSSARRDVQLIEGEALFDVAKNAKRPFFVEADDVRVRAVGTSFTVRKVTGRPTEVLVREGAVEITRRDSPGAVRLGANEYALVRPFQTIVPVAVEPDSMARRLAWQQGMISFEATPLRDAAANFARYGDPQIMVDDPSVASETISGMFAANNPQGFAKAVALSLNLNARTEDGRIHLSR